MDRLPRRFEEEVLEPEIWWGKRSKQYRAHIPKTFSNRLCSNYELAARGLEAMNDYLYNISIESDCIYVESRNVSGLPSWEIRRQEDDNLAEAIFKAIREVYKD